MFGIQMVGTKTEQLWTIRNPNGFGIRAPTVHGNMQKKYCNCDLFVKH